MRRLAAAGALLALCASPAPIAAQGILSVSVDPFRSEKVCTLYESWWGMWLVLECRNNFAAMRDRVRSALAESGRVGIVMGGGRYSVRGTVTEVGVTSSAGGGATYGVGQNKAFASLDIRLVDSRNGRLVWGGTLTKSVEAGSRINAGAAGFTSASGPQAIYTNLQRELALAAARGVAFHIDPLRVTGVEGDSIQLNYGGPLLALGDQLDVPGAGGGRPVRYRVTSASGGSAWAKAETSGLQPPTGAVATYVDADSAAANVRRMERVELP